MKRKITLTIIGILILIIISLSITYAFMRPQVQEDQTETNISIKTCAKIQLKDNGTSINLENTFPMDDDMGLETEPYEFTVSSTCEEYVGFNLYLTSLNDNQIEDSNIHFAITNPNKDILKEGILSNQENGLNDFDDEEINQIDIGIKGTHKNIYKVYSNNIPFEDESNYQLYLWLDKDASNETMGQSFKVGLSIKSYNREETLAEYLIKNKDDTLIYHDNKCDYEDEANCDLEAGDLSYRYSGGNDVVNNYVCFGGECSNDSTNENYKNLYRIIGLFKNSEGNYEAKLIKAQGATIEQLGDSSLEGGSHYSLYSLNNSNYQSYYKGTNWENLAGYSWNSTDSGHILYDNNTNVGMWKESNLNSKNLNQFFYNQIEHIYQDMIISHAWEVGGSANFENVKEVYKSELGENKLTKDSNSCYTQDGSYALNHQSRICNQDNDLLFNANIGLFYISDYMYGTLPNNWNILATNYSQEEVKNNNWLYLGINEWTITRWSSSDYGAGARFIDYTGLTNHIGNDVYNLYGIRPCFYLNSNVKLLDNGDNGTEESPYHLSM